MATPPWDTRFFETMKGRILSLLWRGSRTVDELASALGVTDNAIRTHMAALERDGVVQQRGVRPTGGKPAYTYEVTPSASRLFTKAYIPIVTQLVAVLEEQMTPDELTTLLREVGRRLAAAKGPCSGTVRTRAETAATVLTELGGVVDVESQEETIVLRGYSCPLADAVRTHPVTCQAVESLVAELVGVPVQECCDKGEQPKCCFHVLAGANSF